MRQMNLSMKQVLKEQTGKLGKVEYLSKRKKKVHEK